MSGRRAGSDEAVKLLREEVEQINRGRYDLSTLKGQRVDRPNRSKGAGIGFSPSVLPGLKAWYDATTIAGLSDGSAVAQWNDISGNANHLTQATGSKQPLYKTGIVKGLPIVRFDGVDDFLRGTFGSTVAQTLTIVSIF